MDVSVLVVAAVVAVIVHLAVLGGTSGKLGGLTGAVSAYSLVGHIYTFLKCYLDGCFEEPTLSSMARVVGSILSGELELV